jgi:hypothetical protein
MDTSVELEMTEDNENFYLHIILSIENLNKKCRQMVVTPDYIVKECIFSIDYFNSLNADPIDTRSFKVTVQGPRNNDKSYIITGSPLFDDKCNCNIQSDLKYKIKVYKGDGCKEEVTANSILAYEELVCVLISGDDDMTKAAEFEVTFLEANYNREGEDKVLDMLNMATITSSKGETRIIFPLMYIGSPASKQ